MSSGDQQQNGFVARILQKPRSFFGRNTTSEEDKKEEIEASSDEERTRRPRKWSMGILNDHITYEVPGSILLLTETNQPLGLRHAHARASASSLPPQPALSPAASRRHSRHEPSQHIKKTTADGAIILDPQPEDSHNDPLNWPTWRRDAALLSLGLYCMMGGGMTPILAAGFTNVASTYNVTVPQVALTTGLYMMGLGVGSVFASPTAILYGKRPVYLGSALLFIATAVWCAVSPSYVSLLVARVFQGISISSVECLPSATIAEIFFLHERAYRLGIYTLLLLGGKNLVPLISAVIIQNLGWRWVFWVVAIVVGFCGILLFLFVPESFWDRTPRPRSKRGSRNTSRRHSFFSSRRASQVIASKTSNIHIDGNNGESSGITSPASPMVEVPSQGLTSIERPPLSQRPSMSQRASLNVHIGFAEDLEKQIDGAHNGPADDPKIMSGMSSSTLCPDLTVEEAVPSQNDHIRHLDAGTSTVRRDLSTERPYPGHDPRISFTTTIDEAVPLSQRYTNLLRHGPKKTFAQHMKPYGGRLTHDKWLRVALRPFILFAYPAVLWSSGVYACSIGWLIVLSESVAVIYRSKNTYNFSALSTGLIYLSPFIGGILGTAVAGKVSDIIVRAMSKRNGGLYEPEFRLVMALPVAVATVIGLMGFGWSAQEHDAWIVPTLFFGVISFGCSLGSTTAITFCVDSYRQYAGEALVTLNFSKNIFHGLVFSLFFANWLEKDGSRTVFIWLGVIQLVLMAFSIPMYIFGKRARMWTVRQNFMEKF